MLAWHASRRLKLAAGCSYTLFSDKSVLSITGPHDSTAFALLVDRIREHPMENHMGGASHTLFCLARRARARARSLYLACIRRREPMRRSLTSVLRGILSVHRDRSCGPVMVPQSMRGLSWTAIDGR